MSNTSTITVLGAGYVGLTTAALLAQANYKVYVVAPTTKNDLTPLKLADLSSSKKGSTRSSRRAWTSGTLIPTQFVRRTGSEKAVLCLAASARRTTQMVAQTSVMYFLPQQKRRKCLQPGTVYVQKSTVPVGTGTNVITRFNELGINASYISNPEFLREGTAVYDTLYFDRIVAGGDDSKAIKVVLDVYRQLEQHRDAIAKLGGIKPGPRKGQYIATTLNSAELIKVTANAFLALKISFANSIAILSDKVGA